ncbi:hypothetical protein BTJ40_09655 [Microbulbifer sp. A4B17]|uniref:hypothetical protein n=1 Tax=Microbulbifer sp. A4B17 TaxID=359370 RepID=UPI000D52A9B7|nr:hypothetical protein [Microbulbifer sp. A4B17]AWF81056.1 hypothetical protein BTJ40_09655 [Microbulbifer sp. A4B17]
MAGQDLYQVVSTGRTLHAKEPGPVIRDVAKLFSISEPQARRLLLKGWVIKDQLVSDQALEFRTSLQKIGLRVEVCPAGRFDNRELIAKIKVAQRRKAQVSAASASEKPRAGTDPFVAAGQESPGVGQARVSTSPTTVTDQPAVQPQGSPSSVEQILSEASRLQTDTVTSQGKALWGVVKATIVPSVFLSILSACVFFSGYALWQIPLAAWQGELTGVVVTLSLISVLLALFIGLLLAWPFFCFSPRLRDQSGPRQLLPADGKQALQLIELMADKLGLPKISQVFVSADSQIVSQPSFFQVLQQRLPLTLGLASVASMEGREVLALVGRGLAVYRGRLLGTLGWLTYGAMQRLELMQWAFENERSAVSPNNTPGILVKPFHRMLVTGGYIFLPLLQRLEALHCRLTAGSAVFLQQGADSVAAQIIGSNALADFARKWHKLVHADLLVTEINREAQAMGRSCVNTPEAVRWVQENLDADTCDAVDAAMAQARDPWDIQQAIDSECVVELIERGFPGQIRSAVPLQSMFVDFAGLAIAVTAEVAGQDCEMVENRLLLSSSKESEESAEVLEEYFNRLVPLTMMPLRRPASTEMQAMDLQGTIDWLRSKLVELRDLRGRREDLQIRVFAMQLGAALIRGKVRITADDFCLQGSSLAAAQERIAVKRTELEESHKQLQQIYGVFYQRLCLALVTMPADQRQVARNQLRHLAAYDNLAPHLDRLAGYSHSFAMFSRHLSPELNERELVQKYMALSVREIDAIVAAVQGSELLKEQGLAAALDLKAQRESPKKLPQGHQEALDVLQVLESRCKQIRAAILEHYQIQLATLVRQCLEREKQLQLNPLRLLKVG